MYLTTFLYSSHTKDVYRSLLIDLFRFSFFPSSLCTTGNSWGWNEDGTGCIGCGKQEGFYGCANVRIVAPGVPLPRTILDEQDDASSSSSSSSQNSDNYGGPGASSVETRAGSSGSTTGNEGNFTSNENSGSSTGNEGHSSLSTGNEGHSSLSTGNEGHSGSSTGKEGKSASSSGTGDNLVCYGKRRPVVSARLPNELLPGEPLQVCDTAISAFEPTTCRLQSQRGLG